MPEFEEFKQEIQKQIECYFAKLKSKVSDYTVHCDLLLSTQKAEFDKVLTSIDTALEEITNALDSVISAEE